MVRLVEHAAPQHAATKGRGNKHVGVGRKKFLTLLLLFVAFLFDGVGSWSLHSCLSRPTRRIGSCKCSRTTSAVTAMLSKPSWGMKLERSMVAGGAGEGEGESESGEGREDAIFCGGERIGFMRAAFGVYEEVEGKVVRVNPLCADGEVRNKEEVRGSIAMVLRGSSSDVPCSFVDKARRVGEAGAIGMIVVNDEDSLISPGDSRREGGDVAFPVVGIKLMDAEKMEDKSTVRITFKETDQFSPAQRRFLRAVAIFRDKQGDLTRIVIPKSAKTENVLEEIEEELARRELVIAKMEQKEEEMKKVTLDDIEDIIDVASVIADNLGASIVHVSCSSILLYRPAPGIQDAIIIPEDDDFELPVELAELTDMSRVIQLKDDEEEEEQEEQEIKGMGP